LHRSLGFNISTVCLDCLASLPDVPDGMKRCPTCLESKPFSAFHQNKGRCHGWCKQCKSDWLKERYDPDKKRDENLRKNHGITAYEYDMIFFQQAGLCAICKQPEHIIDPYTKQPKSLAVDHDHRSDEVRQLLCHYCNILLGAYENDIRRMKAVIHYARKHLT